MFQYGAPVDPSPLVTSGAQEESGSWCVKARVLAGAGMMIAGVVLTVMGATSPKDGNEKVELGVGISLAVGGFFTMVGCGGGSTANDDTPAYNV